MARSRSKGLSSVPTAEPANLLEAVAALTDQVKQLTDQVQVLWNAIDDVRQEFEWAVRNDKMSSPRPVMHITSMPKDPCAPDFGARINKYTPQNAPEMFAVPPPVAEEQASGEQRELF